MCWTVTVISLAAIVLQEADPKSTGVTFHCDSEDAVFYFPFLLHLFLCQCSSSQCCEANHSAYTHWELCYGRVAVSQAELSQAGLRSQRQGLQLLLTTAPIEWFQFQCFKE